MKRISIIDVGSHSVHWQIFDVRHPHEPKCLDDKSALSYLGKSVAASGKILPSEKKHLKVSVLHFVKKAKKKHSDKILIVATAGFRKATNGKSVIQEIEKSIKIPIHLLRPDQESELGFLGIQTELKPQTIQLYMDCGGGSTEVSLAKGKKRINHNSFPIGCDTLSIQIENNPPQLVDVLRLSKILNETYSTLPKAKEPHSALISGSNVKHLVNLFPEEVTDTITLDHLNKALAIVLRKKAKKVEKQYGIEKNCHAGLLVAILSVTQLLSRYKLKEARISQKGLRDGVLADFLKNPIQWSGGVRHPAKS